MVARIQTPHSIQKVLDYDEQKIKKGQAELLHAGNYLKDDEQLNFAIDSNVLQTLYTECKD
jgi:hypothetical protein